MTALPAGFTLKKKAGAALPPGFTLVKKDTRKDQFDTAFADDQSRPELKDGIDQKAADAVPGVGESILQGVGQGATMGWLDEIVGLADAEAGKKLKERYAMAQKVHPIATGAGELGGVVGTSLLIPGSTAAKGAGLIARGIAGARTGAITGALYGAGSTDGGVAEKAGGAISGGVSGAALGGSVPFAGRALSTAGKVAALPFRPAIGAISGAFNPDKQAAKRVVAALSRDFNGQPQRAVDMLTEGRRNNTPLIAADTGEWSTAVAGSAHNTSPTARTILNSAVSERFGSQNIRAATVLNGMVRTPANATLTRDALEKAARTSRKPFYDRAFTDGAGGVLTPDIQALARAPVMQTAMKDAEASIKNKVAAGRAMSPMSPNGTPTLEYWNQVKINLDSAWKVANRAGNDALAGDIDAIRRTLVTQLDAAVPSYSTARGVAASLFKANDALDAGEKFVTSRMPNEEARRALSKMTSDERALFKEGFVSKFIDNVLASNDRRTIIAQINANPAARERMNVVLGPGNFKKMEAFLAVESIMDKTRNALQNKSTTMRQLYEAGMAGGGAQAVGGGGLGFLLGGADFSPKSIMYAIMGAGARRGMGLVNENVARRVGTMLASDDPQVIQKAIDLVSRNPRMMSFLNKIEDMVTRAAAGAGGAAAQHEPLRLTVTGGTPAVGQQQGPDGNN